MGSGGQGGGAAGLLHVQLLELVEQHRDGPQIRDQVVQHEQEDPRLAARAPQAQPEQRPALEGEAAVGLVGELARRGLALRVCICDLDGRGDGVEDPLARLVAGELEHGAQHGCRATRRASAQLERPHVEVAVDPRGAGDAVDAVRREALHQPQRALPVR